jgi:hypothetical protein
VIACWLERGQKIVQYHLRDVKAATRKFCKGWGAIVNSQMRRNKKELLIKLQVMDGEADTSGNDKHMDD